MNNTYFRYNREWKTTSLEFYYSLPGASKTLTELHHQWYSEGELACITEYEDECFIETQYLDKLLDFIEKNICKLNQLQLKQLIESLDWVIDLINTYNLIVEVEYDKLSLD